MRIVIVRSFFRGGCWMINNYVMLFRVFEANRLVICNFIFLS